MAPRFIAYLAQEEFLYDYRIFELENHKSQLLAANSGMQEKYFVFALITPSPLLKAIDPIMMFSIPMGRPTECNSKRISSRLIDLTEKRDLGNPHDLQSFVIIVYLVIFGDLS